MKSQIRVQFLQFVLIADTSPLLSRCTRIAVLVLKKNVKSLCSSTQNRSQSTVNQKRALEHIRLPHHCCTCKTRKHHTSHDPGHFTKLDYIFDDATDFAAHIPFAVGMKRHGVDGTEMAFHSTEFLLKYQTEETRIKLPYSCGRGCDVHRFLSTSKDNLERHKLPCGKEWSL